MAINYGYDKNIDYQKLINQDVAAQDFRSAAIHEAQRNAKILGEGAKQYQTTSHYTDYLPKDAEISSGMDRLAQPRQFAWNKEADPSYQAFRKEYLREADRQTRNAMGAAAQMTGGAPSTAAVMAGQQAGQYQVAQLADRVPQLYEAAYNRFNQDREQERADLSLLAGLEGDRADRSLALQQWDWNRQMGERQQNFTEQQAAISNALSRWAQSGVADEYVSSILGVPVGTSTADERYQMWSQQMAERQQTFNEGQQAWQNANTEQQQAWQNAMNRWSMTGVADEYVSSILGVPVGTTTSDLAYQQWQQAMAERQQTQSEQGSAYDRVMDVLETGNMPTAEQLAAAGISQTDAQTIASFYAAQIARLNGTGSGGGSGSGGGTGTGRGTGTGTGLGTGIVDAGDTTGDGTNYYSNSEFQGVLDTIEQYSREGRGYNAAAAYLATVGSRLSAEQTQQVIRLMNRLFPQLDKPGERVGQGAQ